MKGHEVSENNTPEALTAQITESNNEPALFEPNADTETGHTPGSLPPPPPEAPPAMIVEQPKRGRGRPKKAAPPPVAPETQAALNRAEGETIVYALDVLKVAIAGENIQTDPAHREACVSAWSAYLAAKGASLPPEVGLAVVTVTYLAPAFVTPTAKGRLASAWLRVKGWFKK